MIRQSNACGCWAVALGCVWAIVVLNGCADVMRPVGLAELEDPEPIVRIRAIHWAGENAGEEAVPVLVERLAEEDKSVRLYAIASLKRITGNDYGYDYKANAQQRAEAVKRWRQALEGASDAGEDKDGKTRKSE